jgi:hypothetical protein
MALSPRLMRISLSGSLKAARTYVLHALRRPASRYAMRAWPTQ